MKAQIKYITAFFVLICNGSAFASSPTFPNAILTFAMTLSVTPSPFAVAFPLDFLFKKSRKESIPDIQFSSTTKSPLFYEYAAALLDWAFNELDESGEDEFNLASSHFNVDNMLSSESEEDEPLPALKSIADKFEFLRRGRIGPVARKTKANVVTKPVMQRPDSLEYDEAIEKASVHELQSMLKEMKKDEGIFGSKIFTNPFSSTIFSLGTTVFKKVYCGWRSNSQYCNPDNQFGENSVYNGLRRRKSLSS